MNGANAFWDEQANELRSHTSHLGKNFILTASFDEIKSASHNGFKFSPRSTQELIIAQVKSEILKEGQERLNQAIPIVLQLECLDLSGTVDIKQELATLLSFTTKLSLAIRAHSASLLNGEVIVKQEVCLNDLYLLAECLTDICELAEYISRRKIHKILFACNLTLASCRLYFEKAQSEHLFNLNACIAAVDAIADKILPSTLNQPYQQHVREFK